MWNTRFGLILSLILAVSPGVQSPADQFDASKTTHKLMPGIVGRGISDVNWTRTQHDALATGFSPLSCGMREAPTVWGEIGLRGTLGWLIVVAGPESSASEALRRLEVINDTYLSVATPVQVAADELLRCGVDVTEQIARRVRGNYRSLGRLVSEYPAARLLPVEGGWYAVVQVPATEPEETLALELLEREHVLVHPGYYFDFPREAYLILSLLPEPAVLEPAARRILAHSAGRPSSDS